MNETRAKRRGRTPVPDPRTHCVSVRLNGDELNQLDNYRGKMARGEWLRCAGLDRLPAIIPEPNIEKWQELARAASNLNQIAKILNGYRGITDQQFEPVRKALVEFRDSLLRMKP